MRQRFMQFALAYNLMRLFGSKLCGTVLEGASTETIRTRLLKVGARVRQTVRRAWVHIPGAGAHRLHAERVAASCLNSPGIPSRCRSRSRPGEAYGFGHCNNQSSARYSPSWPTR